MSTAADAPEHVSVAVAELARLLPAQWRAELSAGQPDGIVRITIRDAAGNGASFVVAPLGRPTPADVARWFAANPSRGRRAGALPTVVTANYLSPRTRARLDDEDANYVDLTGNVRLVSDSPAIVIRTQGATRDPVPGRAVTRGLGGSAAGQVVRALVDVAPPYNVTELAGLAEVDPGYCSRVLQVLEREALVERGARGIVLGVAWTELLRERARAAGALFDRDRTTSYITRTSVNDVLTRLRAVAPPFVVTGSFAAARIAPVAAPRGLVVYCDQPTALATELDLLPADEGGDVRIIRPRGPGPSQRARPDAAGVPWAAPSQIVLDGLSGTGRMPEEADAVLDWMADNQSAWRAGALPNTRSRA